MSISTQWQQFTPNTISISSRADKQAFLTRNTDNRNLDNSLKTLSSKPEIAIQGLVSREIELFRLKLGIDQKGASESFEEEKLGYLHNRTIERETDRRAIEKAQARQKKHREIDHLLPTPPQLSGTLTVIPSGKTPHSSNSGASKTLWERIISFLKP